MFVFKSVHFLDDNWAIFIGHGERYFQYSRISQRTLTYLHPVIVHTSRFVVNRIDFRTYLFAASPQAG